MEKLLALLAVFRQGSSVADPAVWKNRSMLIAGMVALLTAAERAAAAFGYPVGFTDNDNLAIATAIAACYHVLFTAATSDKVGLPTVGGSGDAGGDQPRRDGEPAEKLYP